MLWWIRCSWLEWFGSRMWACCVWLSPIDRQVVCLFFNSRVLVELVNVEAGISPRLGCLSCVLIESVDGIGGDDDSMVWDGSVHSVVSTCVAWLWGTVFDEGIGRSLSDCGRGGLYHLGLSSWGLLWIHAMLIICDVMGVERRYVLEAKNVYCCRKFGRVCPLAFRALLFLACRPMNCSEGSCSLPSRALKSPQM